MSTIPLYDALVKLGLKNKDAREVVDEFPLAKDVATKEDLSSLKEDLAKLETKLVEKMFNMGILFTTIILGGVGIMLTIAGLAIKFL